MTSRRASIAGLLAGLLLPAALGTWAACGAATDPSPEPAPPRPAPGAGQLGLLLVPVPDGAGTAVTSWTPVDVTRVTFAGLSAIDGRDRITLWASASCTETHCGGDAGACVFVASATTTCDKTGCAVSWSPGPPNVYQWLTPPCLAATRQAAGSVGLLAQIAGPLGGGGAAPADGGGGGVTPVTGLDGGPVVVSGEVLADQGRANDAGIGDPGAWPVRIGPYYDAGGGVLYPEVLDVGTLSASCQTGVIGAFKVANSTCTDLAFESTALAQLSQETTTATATSAAAGVLDSVAGVPGSASPPNTLSGGCTDGSGIQRESTCDASGHPAVSIVTPTGTPIGLGIGGSPTLQVNDAVLDAAARQLGAGWLTSASGIIVGVRTAGGAVGGLQLSAAGDLQVGGSGTAGAPAADVVTVQGVDGGAPLNVNASQTTSPWITSDSRLPASLGPLSETVSLSVTQGRSKYFQATSIPAAGVQIFTGPGCLEWNQTTNSLAGGVLVTSLQIHDSVGAPAASAFPLWQSQGTIAVATTQSNNMGLGTSGLCATNGAILLASSTAGVYTALVLATAIGVTVTYRN